MRASVSGHRAIEPLSLAPFIDNPLEYATLPTTNTMDDQASLQVHASRRERIAAP